MKALNIERMEMVNGGGISQRNCGIFGLGIVGGIMIGPFSAGVGFALAITSFAGAAASDCF